MKYQMIFKGIFTKHVQYFLDRSNDPLLVDKYAGFLGAQASAVIHFGTGSGNKIGSVGLVSQCERDIKTSEQVWYGPNQSQATPKTQASGLSALISAAKVIPINRPC